jgi:hypothetical protein
MSASVPSKPYPRIRRIVRGWVDGLTRIGVQGQFYFQTRVSIREAFARYNVEMVRLIAQMSLGTGALAIIGGSVVIVGFLTLSTGALVAVAGYNEFACSRTRAWCRGRPVPPTRGPSGSTSQPTAVRCWLRFMPTAAPRPIDAWRDSMTLTVKPSPRRYGSCAICSTTRSGTADSSRQPHPTPDT